MQLDLSEVARIWRPIVLESVFVAFISAGVFYFVHDTVYESATTVGIATVQTPDLLSPPSAAKLLISLAREHADDPPLIETSHEREFRVEVLGHRLRLTCRAETAELAEDVCNQTVSEAAANARGVQVQTPAANGRALPLPLRVWLLPGLLAGVLWFLLRAIVKRARERTNPDSMPPPKARPEWESWTPPPRQSMASAPGATVVGPRVTRPPPLPATRTVSGVTTVARTSSVPPPPLASADGERQSARPSDAPPPRPSSVPPPPPRTRPSAMSAATRTVSIPPPAPQAVALPTAVIAQTFEGSLPPSAAASYGQTARVVDPVSTWTPPVVVAADMESEGVRTSQASDLETRVIYHVSHGAWAGDPNVMTAGPLGQLRELRELLMREVDEGCRVIRIVSGTNSRYAKSQVAAQLACLLAERKNMRVLLLEADLDAPALHKVMRLNVPRGFGFSEQLERLSNMDSTREVTLLRVASGLHALVENQWGTPSMFDSRAFTMVLAQQKTEHDFIIVDGPVVDEWPDAPMLRRGIDAVVFVAASWSPMADAMKLCTSHFDREQVLQMVRTGE